MNTSASTRTTAKAVCARAFTRKRLALSAGACSAILAGTMLLGGGWCNSLAYADGYVDGTGNNIYYGYKTDASYTEARFHIEVDYYDTLEHAKAGKDEGKDPLGKFVRVHYLSNCNKDGGTADEWRFRPMWWFGVPKGLQNVQDITYTRVEKLTKSDSHQPFTPAGSSQFTFTNAQGYGQVSQKKYNKPEEWTNISNFYFTGDKVLASKGWQQLLGIDGGKNKGYDNTGNTAQQWGDYKGETAGLQSIFVDWESAGQRYYDMTYVAEMTDDAWEKRDENPLRFAAGVYRFAGNWHYAVGQKHNTPRIADHLTLQYPAVTKVKNLKKLSNDEKGKVQKAIEEANESKDLTKPNLFDKLLKEEGGIVVNDDGSATITFKDNTKRTIPASILVAQDELDSDRYKPQMPELTPVVNPNKLTDEDKKTVIAAFKKANEKNKDFNDHLKSGDDGIKFVDDTATGTTKLVVTYKDGSTLEIPSSNLVRQGATIASWAPYVVPDYMEVDNLKQLSQEETNKIIKSFDDANVGITPYDESKTQNSNKAPVTVNQTTGDATITWKDGSTTTIEAWQFLKEKAKQTPEPPVPAPTAEKTFYVEAPARPTVVTFDPFKTTSAEINAGTVKTQLDQLKNTLKKLKAKDSKDSAKDVTITDVEYSVTDGVGYITFKAKDYKDAKYPMGTFFKQNANSKVLPQNGTTTNSQDRKGYKYNLRKFAIKGQTPTTEEKNAAVKQFIGDNYDGTVNDCSNGTYYLNQGLTPKGNTSGLKPSRSARDGLISYIKAENDSIKFYGTSNNVLDTINDVYLTNQGGTQADTTLADLKALAKKLLNEKKQSGVTNKDLKKAGITDPENLNNADKGIDKMDEKTLRDLIQKLTDAKHYDRKYNTPTLEVDNPDNLTEDNLKAAIKAFLEANYDNADTVNVTSTSDFTLPINLTPKKDTVYMEVGANGVTKIKSASKDGIVVVDGDGITTFTVKPTYTKKAAPEPAPKPGEKSKLDKMKEKAKELIERNPNLTPDQKKQYEKQVDDAKDENGVHTAVNNANEQAKKNKNSTDPNVTDQINNNKQGTTAQQQADNDQKEKDKKDRDKKQEQQLQDDKKKASEQIENLTNLTPDEKKKLKEQINGDSTPANPNGATTPEAVQKILNNAQAINDAKADLKVDALPFLCHGDSNNADDKALKDLIGADLSKKDAALTKIDELLKKTTPAPATAKELNDAVADAKRQNDINKEKAQQVALAKLNALEQEITSAESALTDAQKTEDVKAKISAAKEAITKAKNTVNSATKPSQIKDALNIDTTIKAAKDAISTQVTNAQQTNKKQQENDNKDALDKEKNEQIARINNSGLSDEDKKKAIDDINHATKLGDPTGIANRAIKAQKIKDALKKIDDFKHLNNAQKDAFKEIINSTDANEHKNDDGTTTDDIDDALANAANTDTAMARLAELQKNADAFQKDANGKYSKLSTSEEDSKKKKAFDDALSAATTLVTPDKGENKDAAGVNAAYEALLKAMRDIDPQSTSAGVNTDALSTEIKADKGLKPDDKADPKTPGDPLYMTASKDKKAAFDQALTAAENALNAAKNADVSTADKEAEAQKKIDAALDALIKARLALDGVNTKPLQDAVANADETHKSVKYTNASEDKRKNYDDAIEEGKALLEKLNGKTQAQPGGQGGQQPDLSTKEAKQNALDAALKKIEDAKAALDGAASTNGYPLIAVIPSGSVDNGNTQAPANHPGNTGAAAPSAEAAPAASDSSDSDDASEAAAVAPSRTKGHGKHARIAQTSDPFAVGALAAPLAALAGALSLGAAGSRKRLRSAKHLKR